MPLVTKKLASIIVGLILLTGAIGCAADNPSDPPGQVGVVFIKLTGPDNQTIEINRIAIIALRPPLYKEHVAHGVACIISTGTQNFAVKENCDNVTRELGPPP